MASTDARPVPQKNVAYRHYFAIRKNDGTIITSWTSPDSEISQDGGTMADATNEATEIATNSGCGYIDLTASEMNNDAIVLKVTVTNTDAVPYVVTLFPEEAGDIRANVTQISDDATAADNLELMYDGTGYTADSTAPASRSQVDNIGSASGGALNFAATDDNVGGAIDPSSVAFDGVETSGTWASTESDDGTYHNIDDTANNIDIVYLFPVGGGRTAVEVTFKGYLNGGNDSATIQAYDHVGAGWNTIKTLNGQAGSDDVTETIPLLAKHTGTGAELGNVYIRIECAAQSNPSLFVDQLLVAAVNAGQTVGYADGAIWFDDTASNTNSEAFVDGVADNPVSSWAAVKTLISSVGIQRVRIAAGSTVTLDASSDNYVLIGSNWTLALGGQSIDGLFAKGATSVTGTGEATTTQPTFEDCIFGAATVPPSVLVRCGIGLASGTFTAAVDAGEYILEDCYSAVPGNGSPVFDFSPVTGASGINTRRWSGGATYTLDSNCTLSHEVLGGGSTTVTTGGGNVEIRGITRSITLTLTGNETVQFVGVTGDITMNGATATAATVVNLWGVADTVTDSTTGLGTTTTDRTVSRDNINTEADTALTDYDPPTRAELTTDTNSVLTRLGTPAGADIAADIATVDSNVDAILVDTGTTLPATLGTPAGADLATDIAAIKTDTAATLVDTADMQPKLGTFTTDLSDDLEGYFQIALRSDSAINTDRAALVTKINANEGSGAGDYAVTADSQEAIADAGGGDATAANQTTIINHLTDVKGTGFVKDTHSLTDIEGYVDLIDDGTSGLAKIATDVAAVLVDTGTTLPASIATIDTNVDAILVDTGTTLPATLATIDSNVDAILVDTGTTLPATLTTIEGKVDTVDSNVDAILVDTGTTLPASIATIDTNVDAILVDTGTTIPASISALNDISVADVLTTAMTESYGTDGSAITLAQACYLILGNVAEFAISSTTKTVRQLDGVSTAATYTLDDADNPTSITRAT